MDRMAEFSFSRILHVFLCNCGNKVVGCERVDNSARSLEQSDAFVSRKQDMFLHSILPYGRPRT